MIRLLTCAGFFNFVEGKFFPICGYMFYQRFLLCNNELLVQIIHVVLLRALSIFLVRLFQ
ncbi:4370_t:CDS:2, partial [Gigaspora rosea]